MWCHISIIPALWKAEMGGLWFEASLGKNASKTLSQKQARWDVHPVIPAIQEVEVVGCRTEEGPRQK
jgi:hypothetical protein